MSFNPATLLLLGLPTLGRIADGAFCTAMAVGCGACIYVRRTALFAAAGEDCAAAF